MTFDLMNMRRFLHYINKPCLVPFRLQLFKWGDFCILNLNFDDLWPWYMTSEGMDIQTITYCINKPNVIPSGFQLSKWSEFYILSPSYNMTSDNLDLGIWPLTNWTYKGSHNVSINHVWFQTSTFQMILFHIFSLSYNLPQITFDLDMWPLTSLTNGGPMLHLWPNFGWNPSRHVEGRARCCLFTTDNNSGQSDPYVSFLLRQATQKPVQMNLFQSCWKFVTSC